MDDILLKSIAHLATFDDDDRELQDVDLLIHKGTIKSIGIDIAVEADTDVIDAAHLIVLPGCFPSKHMRQSSGLCRRYGNWTMLSR